jgi:hypothetical protein
MNSAVITKLHRSLFSVNSVPMKVNMQDANKTDAAVVRSCLHAAGGPATLLNSEAVTEYFKR